MTLPNGFLFNQSNLQDFVECQRRFQLRYLLHLDWPAVEVEPFIDHQRLIDLGFQFHKIVRQHLTGIPESQIEGSMRNDETLHLYWDNYRQSLKDGILGQVFQKSNKHFEELSVSTPIDEYRIIAKYDSLIVQPDGKLIILDWKTSQKPPKRKWLSERLQTHVYPYVLSHKIAGITDTDPVDPSQIEMIYWFANQPEHPEHFKYNTHDYESDRRYIGDLVSRIKQKTEVIFPLTSDVKRCQFCTYRSLCDRGVLPGKLGQLEDWQQSEPSGDEISIIYEQIGEIEF